jgi:hypothetical protein
MSYSNKNEFLDRSFKETGTKKILGKCLKYPIG